MNGRTPSWASPSTVIHFAKLVLLCIGGIWGLYLYVNFEEEERTLRNQILELQLTQEEHRKVQTKIEVDALGQSRLKRQGSVKIFDLGPYGETGDEHLFFVHLEYSLTNVGSVEMEVTYVAVEVYLGRLQPLIESNVYTLNDLGANGPVDWELRDSQAWYFAPKHRDDVTVESASDRPLSPSAGGGGTAILSGEETSRGAMALLVVAHPLDWIGFDVKVGVDEGTKPEDRWQTSYRAAFFEAEEPPHPVRHASKTDRDRVNVDSPEDALGTTRSVMPGKQVSQRAANR